MRRAARLFRFTVNLVMLFAVGSAVFLVNDHNWNVNEIQPPTRIVFPDEPGPLAPAPQHDQRPR